MEIEKINQEVGESDLEKFREEIRNLMQGEIDAIKQGKQTPVHFITNIQEGTTNFKVEDLTKEDMEMYYKIKKGEVDLEEFKKYKAKIFSKRGNIFDSRQIFAAYLSNLFMVYSFNRGRNNKK
jgi:hypothetical protein